jgi:hypothetical protein
VEDVVKKDLREMGTSLEAVKKEALNKFGTEEENA